MGTSGTAGTATAGVGGGGTVLCTDSADCDDGKACTLDVCNADGACEHPPKCTGDTDHCCGGVCGQCCEPGDCDDGVECTTDDCFEGVCSNMPGRCQDDVNQYCTASGCMDREQCTSDGACDDQNPCTTDRCQDGLCAHDGCGTGTYCCADGSGCHACCGDSQCVSGGDDPCNPAVCVNGTCGHEELCQGDNQTCCPRAGGTADCGVGCCVNEDCPDVPCTRKRCTPTGCVNDPITVECPQGQTCVVGMGCTPVAQCGSTRPCPPPSNPCEEVRCNNGRCEYSSACRNSTTCCQGLGCRECCSNADCANTQGGDRPLCCNGVCGQCCDASDCGATTTPQAFAPDAPTIGGGGCTTYSCDPETLTCGPGAVTLCKAPLICCPGVGCVSQFQCGAI
jgi:hypothetical protein